MVPFITWSQEKKKILKARKVQNVLLIFLEGIFLVRVSRKLLCRWLTARQGISIFKFFFSSTFASIDAYWEVITFVYNWTRLKLSTGSNSNVIIDMNIKHFELMLAVLVNNIWTGIDTFIDTPDMGGVQATTLKLNRKLSFCIFRKKGPYWYQWPLLNDNSNNT